MSGYIAYVFCTVLLAVSTFSQPARRFFRIRLLFLFFTVIIIVCSFLFLTIATRGHTMIPPIFGFISFLKEVKKKKQLGGLCAHPIFI